MIDICVTHFGNKYSSKYIDNMENGIARNYSGEFRFLVKTDCPFNHWDKISFFECDKPRIVMDIDFLIVGNLDELFNHQTPNDSLSAFPRWWKNGGCVINGGFYKINPGPMINSIVDKFYNDPESWIKYYGNLVNSPGKGEQNFVYDSVKSLDLLPGQWLGIHTEGSERYHINAYDKYYEAYGIPLITNNQFNKQIKLVHFIYDDNMIENKSPWIQKLWNTI